MAKMKVPGSGETAKKWADQTPGRAGYYEANTVGSGSHWESETKAAAANYKQAVSAADIDKRFKGGVTRAGGAKFDRKVKDVGVGRFGPGIAAAEGDMSSGIEPYLAVLAATEIKARGPRGDPANYDLVKQVGDPLHKKRLALLAAGPG
uniref:Uncharacterized protein n=1 Tax=viral metagenome TaxID=1070528 RepID=A0A6M3XS98_9ZZZZ